MSSFMFCPQFEQFIYFDGLNTSTNLQDKIYEIKTVFHVRIIYLFIYLIILRDP